MRTLVKLFVITVYGMIMMSGLTSCNQIEECQLLPTPANAGGICATRSPELNHVIDEETAEIIKADMIGAFEGFLKGIDYAVDKELSEEEAFGVIIISAITHGVLRSHQAAMHNRFPGEHFAADPLGTPGADEMDATVAPNYQASSHDQILASYHKTDLEFIPLASEAIPVEEYPNAAYIGKMHNAILPEIKFNSTTNFSIGSSLYSDTQKAYLLSDTYKESIAVTKAHPTDFTKYYEYDMFENSRDPHLRATLAIKDMLKRFDKDNLKLSDVDSYINMEFRVIEKLSWPESEKNAMRAALMTAAYSAEYWTILHPGSLY